MAISCSAKYLGMMLGPTAGKVQWEAPLQKFKKRCKEMCEQKLPIKLAIGHFSTRAVSVLGYKAQMVLPLPDFVKTATEEQMMDAKVMKGLQCNTPDASSNT